MKRSVRKRRAAAAKVNVLMQVNASNESSKFGVAVGAATHLAEMLATLPNMNLCGLMTMAPRSPKTATSSTIASCAALPRALRRNCPRSRGGEHFRHLSMGMSHDYPIAIGCGATILRIGSGLIEGLPTIAAATT
ncbi:MAG: alanine racemase [Phycisphaerae bacterium]